MIALVPSNVRVKGWLRIMMKGVHEDVGYCVNFFREYANAVLIRNMFNVDRVVAVEIILTRSLPFTDVICTVAIRNTVYSCHSCWY